MILTAVSFAGGGSLFAGQKMQAIMNNAEIGRELSLDELLQQFRHQRERLVRQGSKDGQPHLVKNKIKILDGKISFLETQMKKHPKAVSAAPAVSAVKNVPAIQKPAPASPRPAPAVSKPKAPVSVPWRSYAKPEPRRRIFLAQKITPL